MNKNNRQDAFIPKNLLPLVVVVSGPSGVGKDAILNRLKERKCSFRFIITLTTRQQRPGEKDFVDYHFVSKDEFQQLIQNNGLLEWAEVYGNWYGVPRAPVKEALRQGLDTIIKVDVQGAAHIKSIVPDAVLVFISPPSLDELSRRLGKRRTESAEELSLRLATAEMEMEQISRFDYVILNPSNAMDRAIEDILAVIRAEKCRVQPRRYDL